MKSSVFVAVSGAILATASPLDLFKRKMVTDIVYEYVTVTVTAGQQATHFGPGKHLHPHPSTTSTSTSTSTPPPPPPTSTPIPEPEPVPATTEAPVVVESAAPSPVDEVTVEAQVSVQAAPSPDPSPVAAPATQEAAAPAATQEAAAPAAPTDYASTVVYHHNIHRFNHSAPAVTFSDTHAGYAQQTAEKCVFAHDLTPGNGGYGQNLALWGSSDAESLSATTLAAQATTNMWYDGELPSYAPSNYGLDNPDMSNFENFGHFTQLVWKGTQQVGCYTNYCAKGTIYDSMGSWFTVCNYWPAGNVAGGYGANVLPPLGQSTVTA